jgi:hypothetical protein
VAAPENYTNSAAATTTPCFVLLFRTVTNWWQRARRVRMLTQNGRARRSGELFYPLPTTSLPLETARHMHMHAAGREQRNRAAGLRL